jgi:hypothetical protein
MTFTQFMDKVRRAAQRMGVTDEQPLAMLLACAHIESKAHAPFDEPTQLAAGYHNIFGVHWLEGDAAKGYGKVTYPANKFEPQGAMVSYRTYESLEHAIQNWIWHRDQSVNFRPIQDRAFAEWARELQTVWQKGNDKAPGEVEALYWQYLGRKPDGADD